MKGFRPVYILLCFSRDSGWLTVEKVKFRAPSGSIERELKSAIFEFRRASKPGDLMELLNMALHREVEGSVPKC